MVEVRGDGFFVFVLFADLLAAAIAFVDFATAKAFFVRGTKRELFFEELSESPIFKLFFSLIEAC